jgi:transposase
MANFRYTDRLTGFLMPPSFDEWLPEKHLARFVVEVVDGLDLSAMSKSYRGSGSASYHPAVLLSLLVYGYATGVFSSRRLERATYDSVAFRFIAANDHPDHDTIATFRRRFLKAIEALFVQVLLLAHEIGVLKMGTVALDGTKIHANASRHSALSYEHAGKIETQLKGSVSVHVRRNSGDGSVGHDSSWTGLCQLSSLLGATFLGCGPSRSSSFQDTKHDGCPAHMVKAPCSGGNVLAHA